MLKDNPNKALIDKLEKKYPPKRVVMNSLRQAEEAKKKDPVLPTPAGMSKKMKDKK